MSLIVLILILVLLFGGVGTYPRWGYNAGWGYGPFGIVMALLLVMIIFAVLGGPRLIY